MNVINARENILVVRTNINIRPDNEDILPCVYYIHGGGMEIGSCFYKLYQAFGRLIAHQNISVIMVDFRNARVPSSAPEVAPFPAGLNDCISGFDYIKTNAKKLNIDSERIVISGESGGGNLTLATGPSQELNFRHHFLLKLQFFPNRY